MADPVLQNYSAQSLLNSLFGYPVNAEPYIYADVSQYPFTMDDLNRAIDSMSAEARLNYTDISGEDSLINSIFQGFPKVGTAIGETVGNVLSPLMNQLVIVLILVIIGVFIFSKIKVKGLMGG